MPRSTFAPSCLVFFYVYCGILTTLPPTLAQLRRCNVLDYGAKGDGKTLDTSAIQSALNSCNKNNTQVYFPANYIFLTSSFHISGDYTNIFIENSILRVSDDIKNWPVGFDLMISEYYNHITIGGKGGLIDGQGQTWWDNIVDNSTFFRPNLLNFTECQHCVISGLTFLNSPCHNIVLSGEWNEISNVTILAPGYGHYNTDGIMFNGSNYYIHDSLISVGDDNVAIHANNTLVERVYFGEGHGASIGSAKFIGEVANVTVRDCTFNQTIQALRIKCSPGAVGFFHNLTYSNLTISNVKWVICLTMFYLNQPEFGECVQSNTTVSTSLMMRDITFQNIKIVNVTENIGILNCQPSSPCKNVNLFNITVDKTPVIPWFCANTYGKQSGVQPPSCIIEN